MSTERLPSPIRLAPTLALVIATVGVPAGAAPLARVNIVLPSTITIDDAAGTVTLPLHKGSQAGKVVVRAAVTSLDGNAVKSVGFVVNCPVVAFVDTP